MSALQHKTSIINLVIISLERYSTPVERMKSLKIVYDWGPSIRVSVFNILFFIWPIRSSSYFSIVQFWNVLFYFASLYNGIEQIDKYNTNGREQFNVVLIAWLLCSLMFLAIGFPVRCHPHNDPVRCERHLSSFTGKKIEHAAVKSLQGHSTSEEENMAKFCLDLKNIHSHIVRLAILTIKICSEIWTVYLKDNLDVSDLKLHQLLINREFLRSFRR